MADLPREPLVLILPPYLAHLEGEAKKRFPGVVVKVAEPIPTTTALREAMEKKP